MLQRWMIILMNKVAIDLNGFCLRSRYEILIFLLIQIWATTFFILSHIYSAVHWTTTTNSIICTLRNFLFHSLKYNSTASTTSTASTFSFNRLIHQHPSLSVQILTPILTLNLIIWQTLRIAIQKGNQKMKLINIIISRSYLRV